MRARAADFPHERMTLSPKPPSLWELFRSRVGNFREMKTRLTARTPESALHTLA
jgi:hypothetical protein